MRAETGAEFFASPQRHVLGAHEDAFKDETRWTAITGRVLALSANEEGDLPQVGQFQQMSMEPHLSMYRQLAQNFCAETSLPMSAVGLFTDSPASAEAMQAAEAQLAEDAEYQWRVFRPALLRLQQNVVMLRDGTDQVPTDSWRANVNWTPARWVSPQAASDFVVKAVAAMPELAQTSVMMRRLGLSQGEIDEILTELTRANASGILDRVLAAAEPLAPAAVADEPAAEVTDVVAAG
ncbi:Phage capsid and scaffold [Mycetocola reblochoni REB411]|uniref:Phage capsid and scaffold n=2 Tax=Mycetocola reblochoni TaxID=331618 RepID=A0A1R4IM37_9MICO|nr:Phage capsid and scaffold [Mycetocola reblochoni REB411]